MTLEHLFEPIDVGPMRLPNRIVMAPMERNYANADGTVSERTLAHYEERARGGVGWIDVESTFVDPAGRGRTHQLGLHEDACIPGLRALAEIAHRHGARIGVELHHAGRNTCRAVSGHEVVAPSPVPCPEAGPDTPRALTLAEIDELVNRYGRAAARAAEAGLDAVELHSAHGYLPLAFLSPLTNLRSDEYGGPLENRMRFGLRVIEAFRASVPEHVAVGCRFSADEFLPGGLTLDDTVEYARALERAGCDYLSVSAGVYASFVNIIPPMDRPSGWMLPLASAVKRAVSIPVVGVSRFTDPRDADRALGAGEVDLVAFGRAFLADPEWPRKALEGRLDEILSCIGCNQGCVEQIAAQRDVTCLVNPRVGRELDFELVAAGKPRRVAVVGGGPAGLEVARVAAERGHDVTLYERCDELGGQARLAAMLPHRPGWARFVRDGTRRLERSGVRVELGRELGAEQLRAARPDVLVVATGAEFVRRPGDGGDGVLVVDAAAAVETGVGGARSAVVLGSDAIGLGVAEWLAAAGVRVSVVSAAAEIVDPPGQTGLVERLRAEPLVSLHPDRRLDAVRGDGVRIIRAGALHGLDEEELAGVDAVVLADERRPSDGLAWLARTEGLAGEVYEIGDCLSPRSALEAVLEGAQLGRRI